MRKILLFLSLILDFSAFLFPFVLIFYLILFLSENLFPGFVTNIFDLNIFLIPVIISGFLATFSNVEEKTEEKANKNDYILTAVLAITGFAVLFYKTMEMGVSGFLISLISAILIVFISVIILISKEEEEEKEDLHTLDKMEIYQSTTIPQRKHRKLFSPVYVSAFAIFLIVGILAFNFLSKQGQKTQSLEKQKPASQVKTATYKTYIDNRDEKVPSEEIIKKTTVLVINAAKDQNVSSEMIDFLKQFNFVSFQKGSAESGRYTNATIQFNEKDATAASYLAFLISKKYETIDLLPMESTKSGVILILGEQK